MLLAAATDTDAFWLIALGMGAVVVLVVIALMTLLLRLVTGHRRGRRDPHGNRHRGCRQHRGDHGVAEDGRGAAAI